MPIYDLDSYRLDNPNSLRKPLAAIERLSQIITEDMEPFILQRHKIFPIFDESSTRCIYVMTEGNFALVRNTDGLYIMSVRSPLVLGLSMIFKDIIAQDRHHTLFSETVCRGYKIPVDEAKHRITELNLWPDVSVILSYWLELLFDRDKSMVGADAYSMVRYNLLKIIQYSQTERMNINVEKFIHQHTRLARSGIMKILSDLKVGGYINMRRGRLVSINNLPKNY